MGDTTIALDEDVKADLDSLKVHENESYNDVVDRLANDEVEPGPTATVEVDGDDLRETISEEVQKHLSEVSVDVDLGELDLSGSELTEDDVRTVVRTEIEKTVHERARQL